MAVNVTLVAIMALLAASSTVDPMAAYTTWELAKSLAGLIVITFLSASMVASKTIAAPFTSVFLRVMSASTFASVKTVLSTFRTASLNVMVILPFWETLVAPLMGLKVTVGIIFSFKATVLLDWVVDAALFTPS